MSENIINLKKIPSIVGVVTTDCSVFVDGRKIPKMRCIEQGDNIEIILDERFSYTFHKDVAYLAANFAAQAMAIGAGYSYLGAPNKDMPFAPEVVGIDLLTE